jgi:transposase
LPGVGDPPPPLLRQSAGCSKVSDYEEGDVRVCTAFNRMLGLPGGWVRDVAFGGEAMVVTVALRRRRPVCSGCGARGLPIKDHRVKRWRHLDVGGLRCVIECRLRRLYCAGCGDLPELVEWARPGARYTRDFEDLTAWLTQQMSQTQVTRLMRIGWETVSKIIARVVAEKLPAGRLDGLELIGCDEVSYGADHKFLTCVADHETGGIVWASEGRNAASLKAFFDQLTDEQRSSIRAVSIDMSAGYEKAIRGSIPDAEIAFDPFHVVKLSGQATDKVRRQEYNAYGRSGTEQGKWIKGARYSLLKDPGNQTAGQLLKLAEVVTTNKRMYRAFLLNGELRYIYRLPYPEAVERLKAWLARGVPLAAATVRQARPHDPQTQTGRARRVEAGVEQRTPGSPKQQGEAPVTPRLRIPLRQRPDRDDLPLLRRHPDRTSSPMSHPQTERRAAFRAGGCDQGAGASDWLVTQHDPGGFALG